MQIDAKRFPVEIVGDGGRRSIFIFQTRSITLLFGSDRGLVECVLASPENLEGIGSFSHAWLAVQLTAAAQRHVNTLV